MQVLSVLQAARVPDAATVAHLLFQEEVDVVALRISEAEDLHEFGIVGRDVVKRLHAELKRREVREKQRANAKEAKKEASTAASAASASKSPKQDKAANAKKGAANDDDDDDEDWTGFFVPGAGGGGPSLQQQLPQQQPIAEWGRWLGDWVAERIATLKKTRPKGAKGSGKSPLVDASGLAAPPQPKSSRHRSAGGKPSPAAGGSAPAPP